ncbi:hypothetical protein AB9F29_20295 [Falsihalocynthiibacter sp. S25ZX9]|uniref:hypothetical protein n=1 Tax=Falsihalocynthiibacter sp. S25ZX9 TaxID=3240870 RepID=UPI00350EFEBA
MKKFLRIVDHNDGFGVLLLALAPGLTVAFLNLLSPWINLLPVQSAAKARTWLSKFDADYATVQQYYSAELAENFVLNEANLIVVMIAVTLSFTLLKFARPGADLPSPAMKARGKPPIKMIPAMIIMNALTIHFVFLTKPNSI